MEGEKKGVPAWVWIVALVPVAVCLLGIVSALAIYGVRKYTVNAKQEEARSALIAWGDGLVRCGEQQSGLPPSAGPVPASLSAVSGKKHQSAPGDWSEAAFSCAGFSLTTPQYFQYRFERVADNHGVARAVADLDGDATADASFDLDVTCTAGRCERGTPVRTDQPPSSEPRVASGSPAPASESLSPAALSLLIIFGGACLLGVLAGAVWGIIVAFRESVTWGLLVMFVPFAGLVFLVRHWQVAKRPFFLRLGSVGVMLLGGFFFGVVAALTETKPAAASAQPVPSPLEVPPEGVMLPPPPPMTPLADLQGEPADLSSVMGRARKLANQWQADAALLGIEASTIVGTRIQTQEGGSAKLTFGPSSFNMAEPRSGVFVVTYDKTGIHGAPGKAAALPELPEPMCAPEFVYRRMAGEGQTTVVSLRYAMDEDRRPVWLAQLAGDSKAKPTAFDPQNCQAAAIRQRR